MDFRVQIQKELFRRRYSNKTIETYIGCVERFFKWCGKEPRGVTKKDIREYLERYEKNNASGNTINVILMALKFYFEQILHRRMWIDFKYTKNPKRLPEVLTKRECIDLFENIKNQKHMLMIKFMYSSGFRLSELINLKIKEIDFENDFGYIRNGKGGKDRIFALSRLLKEEILKLIQSERLQNNDYLFRTTRGDKYSSKTVQEIIKKACKRAEINKKVHPHTLRHSFATHLIENGYAVNEVQAMLGHKSPETSMIYVHSASPNFIKIKSPLDSLYVQSSKT